MTIEQIIQRIIDQEIYTNASQFISEITQGDGAYLDDIMPCLSAPDYSEAPDGYTVQPMVKHPALWKYETEDKLHDWFDTEREAIQSAWEDSGEEPEEIEALQHWLVSDWLADKLEQVGALVARDVLGFEVWGRTECGQSLTMDSDLRKVAELIERS